MASENMKNSRNWRTKEGRAEGRGERAHRQFCLIIPVACDAIYEENV